MTKAKKIILLGHFGVGKSSLIRRFVDDMFSEDYKVTIGVHILKKEINLSNAFTTLIIWDIEGHDDINNIRQSYLLGTSGFIYVFDVTRKATYVNLEQELNWIKTKYPNIPLLVVGNKIDLLANDVLKQQADKFDPFIDYFSSAKTGTKVDTVFTNLAKQLF